MRYGRNKETGIIRETWPMKRITERLFVRINRKGESYFSIISFQNEANKVYVSDINMVVFKE